LKGCLLQSLPNLLKRSTKYPNISKLRNPPKLEPVWGNHTLKLSNQVVILRKFLRSRRLFYLSKQTVLIIFKKSLKAMVSPSHILI